jgi:6-phospho-beta-glucosidase
MILNVANRGTVPQLDDDAVIEVPCTVDTDGIRPFGVAPVQAEMLGLMQQVKAVERLVLTASGSRDATLAWRAIAAHPFVDSVAVARQLFDRYRAEIPGVGAAFD